MKNIHLRGYNESRRSSLGLCLLLLLLLLSFVMGNGSLTAYGEMPGEEEEIIVETGTEEAAGTLAVPESQTLSASTSSSRMRLRRVYASKAAASSGKTWYGDQLSGNARLFYDTLVAHYASGGSTDTEITVKKADHLDVTAYIYDPDVEGDKDRAKAVLRRDVQSAWDAFEYDYPEVYWYMPSTYKWTAAHVKKKTEASEAETTEENTSEAETTVYYLTNVVIRGKVAFTDAPSYAAAYTAGVSRALTRIMQRADYNRDGVITDREKVQAAQDYLTERMYYDNARLSVYRKTASTTTDFTIFTSAGAFIDDETIGKGFVCEGYAKSFKILCCEMGVNCIMIPGQSRSSASSGSMGHMWNAVQLGGQWYLVDPTWNDSDSNPYKYFLFAYNTIGDTRSPYIRLSGDKAKAMEFAYPSISAAEHQLQVENKALAQCTGYEEYVCTDRDGVGYFLKTTGEGEGHQGGEDGRCIVCGLAVANASETETETETVSETETETETETVSESESETETETVSKTETETETETADETETETEPEIEIESETQTPSEPESETEKATEKATEKPTEKATEKPTEKATEKPTEKATEKQTEKATEKPTEKATEKQTEKRVTVKKTRLTGARASGSGRVVLTWKRVRGITGYQIQYSTSRTFKKAKTLKKTVKRAKTTKVTLKRLKKRKRYYFRIRTYKVVSGHRVYSSWSSPKVCRIR